MSAGSSGGLANDPLSLQIKAIADQLEKLVGPEGAVVVMVGAPEGNNHSLKRWQWRGRCLQVEGLLSRCGEEIRKDLW